MGSISNILAHVAGMLSFHFLAIIHVINTDVVAHL